MSGITVSCPRCGKPETIMLGSPFGFWCRECSEADPDGAKIQFTRVMNGEPDYQKSQQRDKE